ncbi:IPT/TIG domain-containing protein [Streptomyces sp. NPDC056817]|uniref:IPT/TIG domain-containing protein n=1 Tax=Streptomyces sp. NPDC056817 TaxID=3345950 RepID=UPI003698D3BF
MTSRQGIAATLTGTNLSGCGAAAALTGSGLLNATAVRFDTAAASFTVVSATRITVVTPAHAAGAATFTVLSPTSGTAVAPAGAAGAVTTPAGVSNGLTCTRIEGPAI